MSDNDNDAREVALKDREDALRAEIEKQRSSRLKTAGAFAGGAAVGAIATGARAAGGAVASGARAVSASASGAGFWLFFALGMVVFFIDWNQNFYRSGSYSTSIGGLWLIVGIGGYWLLRSQGHDQKEAIRTAVIRTVWSFILPLLLAFFVQQLAQNGSAIPSAGKTFGVLLLGVWTPLVLMYFGWPHFLMRSAGERMRLFALIDTFVFFMIFAAIFLPILGTVAMTSEEFGVTTASLQPVPKLAALGELVWETLTKWFSFLLSGVTGRINTGEQLWRNATQPKYVGQVERSQGQPLGVTFKNLQPIKPVFNYRQDNQSLSPIDSTATFFGTVQARTLTDDFEVELSCVYQVRRDDGLINYTGTVRPQRLYIHYTGEFVDEFPFECSFELEDLPYDTPQDLTGRFFVEAHFPFDTWGYTTLTFMDRDIMTALRRENVDPARSLGIEARPTPRYTPGPVGLGMDTVPQPIGIDIRQTTSNFLPAFGVTIENAWYSQGDVEVIESLILQVPDPLTLDTQNCLGVGDSDSYVHTPRDGVGTEIVPDGYTWYEFNSIRFGDDTYKTVRCPLVVDDRAQAPWQELLGPDLSPRQYTLVARASYDYTIRSPVAMRLGVERFT